MLIVLGGVLGFVAGLGAWQVAQRFVPPALADRDQTAADLEPGSGPIRLWQQVQGAIPMSAALVTGGMALWGAYLGWRAPGLSGAVVALGATGLLLAISLVDFQVRRIPNALVLVLLVVALVQVLWLGQPAPLAALFGLAVGGGLFLLAALVGRGAMGAGDAKLAAVLGALLGFPLVLHGLLLGVLTGGLAALILLAARRAGRKDYMAYGPYLALGAWLVWTQSLGLWA